MFQVENPVSQFLKIVLVIWLNEENPFIYLPEICKKNERKLFYFNVRLYLIPPGNIQFGELGWLEIPVCGTKSFP